MVLLTMRYWTLFQVSICLRTEYTYGAFSGHDEVLNDVFQYHEPPIRRLPELILKRILHEIDEYICRPAINGHRVIRYFHRQFHKFFKQYRTEKLYILSTKYFLGQLAMELPNRKISPQNLDDSLHMSELPFLLMKSIDYDKTLTTTLLENLSSFDVIRKRMENSQLQEYLDDCRITIDMVKTIFDSQINGYKTLNDIDRLEKMYNFIQKKKNWLEVSPLGVDTSSWKREKIYMGHFRSRGNVYTGLFCSRGNIYRPVSFSWKHVYRPFSFSWKHTCTPFLFSWKHMYTPFSFSWKRIYRRFSFSRNDFHEKVATPSPCFVVGVIQYTLRVMKIWTK